MKTTTRDGIEDKLTPKAKKEETYKDWRLPTLQELLTLINCTKHDPSCNLKDTASFNYWSSSTVAPNTDSAWSVYFYYGYDFAYYKSYSCYVRCVRDGINGLEWSASSESIMTWNEAKEYAEKLEAPVYYKEN